MTKKLLLALCLPFVLIACKKDCECPKPEETCKTELTKGLVAYFPFDGNNNDVSGNGNNASAKNGAFLTTDYLGRANSAAGFDGVDDYVIVPGSEKLNTDSISISYQIMVNNSNRRNATISRINFNEGNSLVYGIHESLPSDNKYNFFVAPSTDDCTTKYAYDPTYDVSTNGPIQAGRWYNVIATFGNGSEKIYVNGKLQASTTRTFLNLKRCANADLLIGGWWKNDIVSLDGKIDEVRIYNRVVSDCEIDELSKVFKEDN